jgi:hypothetical protein
MPRGVLSPREWRIKRAGEVLAAILFVGEGMRRPNFMAMTFFRPSVGEYLFHECQQLFGYRAEKGDGKRGQANQNLDKNFEAFDFAFQPDNICLCRYFGPQIGKRPGVNRVYGLNDRLGGFLAEGLLNGLGLCAWACPTSSASSIAASLPPD